MKKGTAVVIFVFLALVFSTAPVFSQTAPAPSGEPIKIGGIEKMSKSKKNTIDPDDIMGSYGADVARWFMLSDSPPERDVEWTERVRSAGDGKTLSVELLTRNGKPRGEIVDSAELTAFDRLSAQLAAGGGARAVFQRDPAPDLLGAIDVLEVLSG